MSTNKNKLIFDSISKSNEVQSAVQTILSFAVTFLLESLFL